MQEILFLLSGVFEFVPRRDRNEKDFFIALYTENNYFKNSEIDFANVKYILRLQF